MLVESRGNLLDADADALVNAVNTVGVMGKGIALQFRQAHPEMFEDYAAACRRGDVVIGRVHVWGTGSTSGPRYVLNVPTKTHWRSRSHLEDIRSGLDDLVRVVRTLSIGTIALPALGCGHGGLAWPDVRPLIVGAFGGLPDVEATVYVPGSGTG